MYTGWWKGTIKHSHRAANWPDLPCNCKLTYRDSLSTEFAFLNHFSDVLKRSTNSSSVRSTGLCFLLRNKPCHLSSLNVLDALTVNCPSTLYKKKLIYSLMCSSSSSYKPQYKMPSTFSILYHILSKYITWSGRILSLGVSTLILHQLHSTYLLWLQIFMCCCCWLYEVCNFSSYSLIFS